MYSASATAPVSRMATTTGQGTISKPATDSPNVSPATAVPDSTMPTASKPSRASARTFSM